MCHYLFFSNQEVSTYSMIFLEANRFLCFFLVCYFFCKKSAHILPSSKKWLLFLRVFLIVSTIGLVGILIVLLFLYDV